MDEPARKSPGQLGQGYNGLRGWARAQVARALRGSNRGAPPKRAVLPNCKWSNTADGPSETRDSIACHRSSKDGSPQEKPIKPFDPAKRRFQSDGLLTEKSTKLIKRLKKSKKHKKRARDSSDSDSDSS